MKKILPIIMFAIIAMCAPQVKGATAYRSVVIEKTDGTLMRVAMENDMTAKVSEGEVIFSSGKGDIKFPISDLRHWSYSTEAGLDNLWTDIDEIDADSVGVERGYMMVSFKNLPAGSLVSLMALDGRTVGQWKAEGYFEVSLTDLTPGVYVLTYNDKSIKVAVAK